MRRFLQNTRLVEKLDYEAANENSSATREDLGAINVDD